MYSVPLAEPLLFVSLILTLPESQYMLVIPALGLKVDEKYPIEAPRIFVDFPCAKDIV